MMMLVMRKIIHIRCPGERQRHGGCEAGCPEVNPGLLSQVQMEDSDIN